MAIGDADRLHAAGGWVRKYKLSGTAGRSSCFRTGRFCGGRAWRRTLCAIEYQGRIYIGYGSISDSFRQENIDQCVGYVLQEDGEPAASDRDRRLYTLAEDPEHHF